MNKYLKTIDWHNTQNESYLELLKNRLKQDRLKWVDQFINIINFELPLDISSGLNPLLVNEIGCNVGHFYRGISDIKLPVVYKGYDISNTYLTIAKEYFGDEHFEYLDITDNLELNNIRNSNVTVMSATLEHLVNYKFALNNIFKSTNALVIIRTFLGDELKADYCRTKGASDDYLISQFTHEELNMIAAENDWYIYKTEIDSATEGMPKMVCESKLISRTQSVLLFKQRRSENNG
jgi:SAM-dependent methyltransferase